VATNGHTTRAAQARTDDALRAATWAAFATITLADIAGWVTHAEYLVSQQPS
jgi:hypothetical protein